MMRFSLYQGTSQCIKKNEGGEIRPLSLKKILKKLLTNCKSYGIIKTIQERKKEVNKMICDNCKNRTNCELAPYTDECDKNRDTFERLFIVDTDDFTDYAEFTTYREAELYCGERGISTENIYQEEE